MIPDALTSIAAAPPNLPAELLHELLAEHYGICGQLKTLVSERDQNVLVEAEDGIRFVFKVASATEDALVTDFQVQALRHLASARIDATVPQIQNSRSGGSTISLRYDGIKYIARLVSFVEGDMLAAQPVTPGLANSLGEKLAILDAGLAGFEHAGDRQLLLWDMQRASELGSILHHIDDANTQDTVFGALQDFEERAPGLFPELRQQVIHGDANPGNVVLGAANESVHGFIDFGDMIRAPLIVDVAITAAYLRVAAGSPTALIAPFVAAYQQHTPLTGPELELLYFLVRTRLATTVAILYWRIADRDVDDPYRRQSLASEADAIHFLRRLDALGPRAFQACLPTF
jgi:Ser/Thr protein kinase RdoA (MazF antagonist)